MLDITWLEPKSIAEATQMLAHYGEDGKIVAGGTWLTLVLKQGLLRPTALISLRHLSELRRLEYLPGQGLRIGALVTHREIELSPLVRQRFPMLAETFATVANVRIRHQATVGGNLCDADYASDPPAMLVALDASVTALSQDGQRSIPVRDLIRGHYTTALQADEVLTHILIPETPAPTAGVYLKYRTRSHEDRPCVGVAVVLQLLPDGRCGDLQVVIGAVSGTPQRLPHVLEQGRGQKLDGELIAYIASRYAAEIEPLSDLRASAWYRKQMIQVFTRRGLEAALQRARQQEVVA
jgi:carbon-monoxide dehydrogenase medium subunit